MALGLSSLQKGTQSIVQKKEEKRWNELIDAVMDGKVIPVIGPDLLIDDEEENEDNADNLHQQIINLLANVYGVI